MPPTVGAKKTMLRVSVDTTARAPDYLMQTIACLSPSTDADEPHVLQEVTVDEEIPFGCLSSSAPTPGVRTTYQPDNEMVESPKCASLANMTGLAAFSRDDDDDDDKDVSCSLAQVAAYQDAASVGLMASGLAWVRRRQKSPRYAAQKAQPQLDPYSEAALQLSRYPIDQQLKLRLQQLKLQDKLQRLESAKKKTAESVLPPPAISTSTSADGGDLEVKSAPTSPSFMSRVYSNLLTTRMPLSSNISIPNKEEVTTPKRPTTKRSSSTCSPQRTELTPRFSEVNNLYSLANLQAGAAAMSPSHKKKENIMDDDESDSPLGYFCHNGATSPTTSKDSQEGDSPKRSALSHVILQMGSDSVGDDGSDSSDDEDDDRNAGDDDYDIHGIAWIPPVRCVAEEPGRGSSTSSSSILNPRQMHQIARHVLPKGIAACQWKRLYSLVRDGDSFDVFLHYARKDARTLLVVRTTRGAILGGYAAEVWAKNFKGEGYYGKSDTCLFTFVRRQKKVVEPPPPRQRPCTPAMDSCCENVDPLAGATTRAGSPASVIPTGCSPPTMMEKKAPSSRQAESSPICSSSTMAIQSPPRVQRPKKSLLDEDDHEILYEASLPPIQVYRYTGVNRYLQYCDASKKMVAFGGGGDKGSFGLCVEQEFQGGSTGHCDTFDNEPLCDQENFKIVDVELWGFLTGQF